MSNPTTVYLPDANLIKTIRRMIHGPGIEANDEDAVVIARWHKDQIKQLEDKVSKLEMQNDHLEEGCNERDKEIAQLKADKENIQPLLRELERIAKVYGYQETVDIINGYNEKQNY